ncbi:MAG: hypothetical protein NXY59_00310 [Aigarchaeota archaeon]|nr:hypothetical protein [Candidatus Pelearchaeum maunauluense]
MDRVFARCKTCHLWFNTGISVEGFKESASVEVSCPVGHLNTYSREELRPESSFERRYRRVAGRLVNL